MINLSTGASGAASPLDALSKYKNNRTFTGGGQTVPWYSTPGNIAPATPTIGNSVVMFNRPAGSVGRVELFRFDLSGGYFPADGRMQVFVDQESIPSIDVDFGTMFGFHYDARTTTYGPFHSAHILSHPAGDQGTVQTGGGDYASRCSGGWSFPMPYSNGITIRFSNYAVSDLTSNGGAGIVFADTSWKEGMGADVRRLRSWSRNRLNAITLGQTTPDVMFLAPGIAGWVVAIGASHKATSGGSATDYTYLEKNLYIATNGESVTIDSYGNPQGPTHNGGGWEDDTTLVGWYVGGHQALVGSPHAIVTCNNNGNFTYCAISDLLSAFGGVKLAGGVQVGKGWGGCSTSEIFSHSGLYYVDTSVPAVPGPPSLAATVGSGSVTLTLDCTRMSQGSSPGTSFAITYTGGSTGSATLLASAYTPAVPFTKVITGLASGQSYTFSVAPVNAVGSGTTATISATPS